MRRRARLGMMTAALLLASSSPARADDKAAREAEARFTEGLARVKSKDYEAARLSFAQAYAVLHRPLILWNLALSEEKTGHPLDALSHFRQVAREAASDADRTSAQKHVDTLLAQVARVDIQAPPGAALSLDGADAIGTAPLMDPVDVLPGHHVVEAKTAGGTAKTSDVDAIAGQLVHVTFAADAPAPVAVSPGTAGAPASPAPTESQALSPAPPDVPQTAQPFWTPRTITATVLVGGAAVAAGFGVFFGLESQSNQSTAEGYAHLGRSYCTITPSAKECVPWNDAVNAQNRDAIISNVLYFTGGVLAVGALASWFIWPKHGHAKTAWVAPEVERGGVGVGAGGSF